MLVLVDSRNFGSGKQKHSRTPEPISLIPPALAMVNLGNRSGTIYHVLDLMIIGGGKMGQALAQGILSANVVKADSLGIVEASESLRAELGERFPNSVISDQPMPATSTVIAVKPGDVEKLATSLRSESKQRVLSIAAGISTAAIEVWLGGRPPVIRAMPNTPAMLGLGMTALCAGRYVGSSDMEWADLLMSAVGKAVVVKESQIDAITAVSGSGPAYVFLVAEAMIDAAVKEGLAWDLARELVTQTIYGSGAMLSGSTQSPTQLRQNVTSPGGTTAAAVAALEEAAVRAAFAAAVLRAKERSMEITAELFKH